MEKKSLEVCKMYPNSDSPTIIKGSSFKLEESSSAQEVMIRENNYI